MARAEFSVAAGFCCVPGRRVRRIPGFGGPSLLNVYTEPEFRQRGIARRIMGTILAWLKEQGFPSASLHASDEGRPLYEDLGFEATNEMRLRFGAGK